MIIQMENLCDSDKYSFTLTFEKVQSHLPENILKMIEDGEASFMFLSESENAEDRHSPALARRLYLQDMYRFYRLFSMRREFLVPFDKRERYLFLASNLFDGTPMEDRLMQIASFLMKRHHYEDVEKVIAHVPERCRDYQYYMVTGSMLQHLPYSPIATCMEMYRKAMDMKPDDHKAMAAFARVSFGAGRYQTAADVYQQLLEMQPDSRNYTLNLAICLSNLNRYEEAEKYLYKLNYLYADDTQVNRALAWVLTLQNKLEQAQKLYTQLLAVEHPVPVDLLDYGYCLWFSGDIANAVIAFQQFMMAKDDEHFNMETEFMVTEHDLLLQHQINDVEIQLMLNAIAH
jgi:tetratricopeptide (TPR) repeat protein